MITALLILVAFVGGCFVGFYIADGEHTGHIAFLRNELEKLGKRFK